MPEMDLSARAREVLGAIIKEYIVSGEAIGSRTLVKRHSIDQSPATVRNVMADLEEHGLLHQPHTSSGRVPTDSGLRFYVDRLMQVRDLTEAQRREIVARYDLTGSELQGILREVTRLLSEVSQQCAVVLVPRSEVSTLRRIEFLRIGESRLLAVLVMSSGIVQNRLIDMPGQGSLELQRMHNYLNELCAGHELGEVRRLVQRELEDERNHYDEMISQALKLGAEALERPIEDELVVEGTTNLFNHPGIDRDQLKQLMRSMEQKQAVLQLLDRTMLAEGVQVFIGAETRQEEMKKCALVTSSYGGERALGTLGVIGPTNMDYPRVISLVDFTAGILTRFLES